MISILIPYFHNLGKLKYFSWGTCSITDSPIITISYFAPQAFDEKLCIKQY